MTNKDYIKQLMEDSINSIDNIKRAEPAPFLAARVMARLNKVKDSMWDKIIWLIAKPSFTIPALLTVVLINVYVIAFNKHDINTRSAEQLQQNAADEFSYTVASIYDIENTEINDK